MKNNYDALWESMKNAGPDEDDKEQINELGGEGLSPEEFDEEMNQARAERRGADMDDTPNDGGAKDLTMDDTRELAKILGLNLDAEGNLDTAQGPVSPEDFHAKIVKDIEDMARQYPVGEGINYGDDAMSDVDLERTRAKITTELHKDMPSRPRKSLSIFLAPEDGKFHLIGSILRGDEGLFKQSKAGFVDYQDALDAMKDYGYEQFNAPATIGEATNVHDRDEAELAKLARLKRPTAEQQARIGVLVKRKYAKDSKPWVEESKVDEYQDDAAPRAGNSVAMGDRKPRNAVEDAVQRMNDGRLVAMTDIIEDYGEEKFFAEVDVDLVRQMRNMLDDIRHLKANYPKRNESQVFEETDDSAYAGREPAADGSETLNVQVAVDAFRGDDETKVQELIGKYGVVMFFDTIYKVLGLADATEGHEDLMRLIGYVKADAPTDEVHTDSSGAMVGSGVEEAVTTAKDYNRLAAMIKGSSTVEQLGQKIMAWLPPTNKEGKFDRARFAKAAGLSESTIRERGYMKGDYVKIAGMLKSIPDNRELVQTFVNFFAADSKANRGRFNKDLFVHAALSEARVVHRSL